MTMDTRSEKFSAPPPLRPYPAKLFVETTSRCNLGCAMCVKQSEGCDTTEGDISPRIFAGLEPAFPHLEALVLNGVGEPLMNLRLEEFIRQARSSMPTSGWIGFQTNGLLLTKQRAMTLADAGLDRICLSIDGASPETFSRLRTGGELPAVDRALREITMAKERCGRPDLQVGIEFVVMRSNIGELPAALRWAAGRGVSFAIVTHLLPYDPLHASETLYAPCTDEAVALLADFTAEARRQGLDLTRYFEARWHFGRNNEDARIVALVEAMKTEAARRNIFLDLKKLLRVDLGALAEVEAVFDQAREVARETGIDLRLPQVVPRESRCCSFVEEGSSFVSWDGGISPCYFLWHRYRCFASGWDQPVEPRVFGNLREKGILEIWNDPAFRSFREGVLAYDYPACGSCSLAPCDYVQAGEFEQDCHLGSVPCGACLWCTGVFQCLR